jgi:nucleotide-binding universal stress UspA family protein
MWFKKLLCAVDFSPPSRIALDTATAMAADSGAELVLVHVVQPSAYFYGMPVPTAGLTADLTREAERRLEEWRQFPLAAGAKRTSSRILTGVPWHEIVEMARKDEAFDLVVLGTHGHTGLKHVLLGSVAEKVVRHAPCPVLVVRTRD